jgi:hypothetical protein
VIEFDHREGFQMQARVGALQTREQIRVVLEREFRVQPADDVQLGRALRHRFARHGDAFLDAVRVSVGHARRAIEAAELAVGVADVRVVEMAVDVEVSAPPVEATTHGVGQLRERGQIVRRIQSHAVFKRQPLAGFDFGSEPVKLWVV